MQDVKSMTKEELKTFLSSLGEPSYRASQVFRWLHKERAVSFDEMTDLPKSLREKLKESAAITTLQAERIQESRVDGTKKVLLRLPDGNLIESVLMRYKFGDSVCVSTQVGCRMGCRFCASTIGGLVRNLTASEILDEVYFMEREFGVSVSHVVLMGSGEPFDNYENVIRFLRLLISPEGKNLSARHVTLSTSGIPEKIRAFAEEGIPATLALSLHAADQKTRSELMPVSKAYPLPDVMAACDAFFEKTGRRVTYEYAVVRDVNDTASEAEKLSALLRGKNAHVNLIPVNPVRERDLKRPEPERVLEFQKFLEKNGINATIRRELGADIDGACGQLRARTLQEGQKGETV